MENWHLFLYYYRYFDKSFAEMFLEKSSTNYMNFVQIIDLIGCHGNQYVKFSKKNIQKSSSQKS